MLNRYKVLYDLFNNHISNINIEYILHVKYFEKNKIYVFFPLLIPNNDTTKILHIFTNVYIKTFTSYVIDIGSGTGIFRACKNTHFKFTKWTIIDKNYLSLKVSKLNIKKNLRTCIFFCNWIYLFLGIKKFNIIITNPPYIAHHDFPYYFSEQHLSIKNAILSTCLGFYDIYNIIKSSYDILSVNGIIIIEHNYSQSKKIRKVITNFGFTNICTYNDINNLNRITYAEK